MFLDARQIPRDEVVETDLCVIGGGAAGIAMAREFTGGSVKVCLVESGGLEFDADTQSLYEGNNIGREYYELDVSRLRFFGGSTNHWGGWCGLLNKIDFQRRPWVPYSGWPITRADLDPYYERADAICNVGLYIYDERVWQQLGYTAHPFADDKVVDNFWQMSRDAWKGFAGAPRFGELYGDDLKKSENVTVLLHANVTNIQANDAANSVRYLDIRTLDGNRAKVRARAYVLCCGGIENARVLLASDTVEVNGLGNGNDLVGRFFMEHPHTPCATISPEGVRHLVEQYSERLAPSNGITYRAALRLSADAQRRDKVLNGSVTIDSVTTPDSGVIAAQTIWRDIKEGRLSKDLGAKLWEMTKDLGPVMRGAYQRFVEEQPVVPPYSEVYLYSRSEQAPNPDSRVLLSEERDALGMRRADLDWRLTKLDKRTVKVMTQVIGTELTRLNLARVRIDDWLLESGDQWDEEMGGGHHHMGTTRMTDDPRQGVVDKNCRMHRVENLYVAGSSVFPTSGYVNPTLTIVALSLRLVDHLKTRLS